MAHTEKTISETEQLSGKIFTVKKRTVILEDGQQAQRDIVCHNGGAAVLPIDNENNVYLIKQFRAPFECEVLEIPAGKLEIGEDPFEAAKRELQEETGFTAKEYISLGQIWPTVGYCTEKIYLYLAQNLTLGKTNFDSDEFVTTVKMPFETAYNMCIDGSIKDGKTLAAVMKVKAILNL